MKRYFYKPTGEFLSRRELLARGVIGLSALSFLPLWQRQALGMAEEAAKGVPFLVFDLAGGAALPGNFLAMSQSGDLLKNYDVLGWNPHEAGALDTSFGIPLSVKMSKLREGLYANTSPEARAGLRLSSFAHYSQDDTFENMTSAAGLVSQLKTSQGRHLRQGVGTETTLSGGKTAAPGQSDALKPQRVATVADLVEALSFGPAFRGNDAKVTASVSALSRELTEAQLDGLGEYEGSEELVAKADALYRKSAAYHAGIPESDPRGVDSFQKLYNISPTTAINDPAAISATIVMNVLNQATGPGVITIGGCDYHDNNQTNGDAKDLEVGVQIGRAVEAAHRLKRPLFFQILTDGGIYADKGTRIWKGDAGDKSMTVIGYYDPVSPVKVKHLQVGHYTESQGAERKTLLGGETKRVAYAVFANYLHVTNQLGEFEKMGGSELTREQMESVLVFE